MALEERFIYVVHPRRPIRNLIKGKVIIKPETLSLSKEEVLACLKYGAVYRKFYTETPERVYPSNLDRLHRSKYLTETAYAALIKKEEQKTAPGLSDEGLGVEVPPLEEDNNIDESTVESKKAEEEQLSIDNSSVENTIENDEIEKTVEDKVEEKEEVEETSNTESFIPTDILPEDNSSNGKNYPSRKSKKKNKNRQNNSDSSSVPETANK